MVSLRTPPSSDQLGLGRQAGGAAAAPGSPHTEPRRRSNAGARSHQSLKRVLSQLRSSLGHQGSRSNKAALSLLCRHPFLWQRALHTELTESSRRAEKKGARLCAFQSRESGGRHGGVHLRGLGAARRRGGGGEEYVSEARGAEWRGQRWLGQRRVKEVSQVCWENNFGENIDIGP